jgi:hypothetical protein
VKRVDTPGTIRVHPGTPYGVINVFAQYYPGAVQTYCDFEQDSRTLREQWFRQCLNAIAELPGIRSIALPLGMGCGLGGGRWAVYEAYIAAWARAHPELRVVLYQTPLPSPIPVPPSRKRKRSQDAASFFSSLPSSDTTDRSSTENMPV